MAKFKTDYKDEIVDKRTRQIVDAGTGAIIHNNVLIKNTYTPKQDGDKVGATWFNDAGKALNDLGDGLENCRSITATIATTQVNASNDIRIVFNTYLQKANKKDVDTSLAEILSDGTIKIKKAGRYLLTGEFNYILHQKKGIGVVTICYVNGGVLAQTVSGARWSNLVGGSFASCYVLNVGDIIKVGANTDYDVSDIGRAVLDIVYLGGAN